MTECLFGLMVLALSLRLEPIASSLKVFNRRRGPRIRQN